jgi:hypothetical protein
MNGYFIDYTIFDNPIGKDIGNEYIYTSEFNYGVGI